MFRPNLSATLSRFRRHGGKGPALRSFGAKWHGAERFWFSSDSDKQERNEKPPVEHASILGDKDEEINLNESEHDAQLFEDIYTEGIDSVGNGESVPFSTHTPLGDQEPQDKKKKYVPFFEEIDAIMAAKGYPTKKTRQNVASIDYFESRGRRDQYDPTERTRQNMDSSDYSESRSGESNYGQNISGKENQSSPSSSLASILSKDFSVSEKANNTILSTASTTTRTRPSLSDILSRGRKENTDRIESNSTSETPSALASLLSQTRPRESSRPTLSSILAKSREETKPEDRHDKHPEDFMNESSSSTLTASDSEIFEPGDSRPSQSPQQQSIFYQPAAKSIFDAFPVPEAAQKRSPNAYDRDAYDQYIELLNDIVSHNKFTKAHTKKPLSEDFKAPVLEWLRRDEKTLDYNLPMLENAVAKRVTNFDKEKRHDFRNELQLQKAAFMERTGMDNDQIESACKALIALSGQCAKHAKSLPMEICWRKLKEAGYTIDSNSLSACLYASSAYSFASHRNRSTGLISSRSEGKSSIMDILGRNPDSDDCEEDNEEESNGNEDDIKDLPGEIAIFHDLLYDATEKSLSIRVRSLVADGDPEGAEEMLERIPSKLGDLRHRTYLPVLRLYLDKGNISAAVRIFKKMRGTSTVYFEPETYVQYISAITEHGFFSPESDPIEGANEAGYSPASGPQLFDQIAAEMAEDILEISSASARRLYTAFKLGFQGTDMGKKLEEIHPLAPLSPRNKAAEGGELIASRVSVDSNTAICPRSGVKLRLINLEGDEKKELHEGLLELSASTFEEFAQKVARDGNYDKAQAALSDFATWLDTREGDPFTAIIDGANVAFFGQNFAQGKFNYHQIQFVVDALEKMNENPLVIIPYKYGQSQFFVHGAGGRVKQFLNDEEKAILENLQQRGKLYRVPSMWLDDFFWMLASVSDQTKSRNGADLDIAPDNGDSRFPGARPMLLSNDQMRDHKLELISPRLFRRWYSCHIVNYSFTAFVDGESVDREIGFSPADTFSREIQGNSSSVSSGQGEGGTAWHFPVSDWELNERMCIRIPTS